MAVATYPAYTPTPPTIAPQSEDTRNLADWMLRELHIISQNLNQQTRVQYTPIAAPPPTPREGLIAYADGINWNPGNFGSGLRQFRGGVWQPADNHETNFVWVDRTVSQTGIADSATVKVQLNNKRSDVDNVFDATTNFRYQPNIAGTFLIAARARIATSTSIVDAVIEIFKNGTVLFPGGEIVPVAAAGITFFNAGVSALVAMNGTTDFIEIFAFNSSSPAATWQMDITFLTAQRVGP